MSHPAKPAQPDGVLWQQLKRGSELALGKLISRYFNPLLNYGYKFIGLSYQAFKEAVWLERRLELTFEGHRRFDLVRTGRLLDAVKAEVSFNRNPTIQPFHVLLPIPQPDRDANPNLAQNQG